MHHHPALLALSAALLSLTSLAGADIQKRSFSVERVRNPAFTGHDGPRAMVKTHRKFRMPLPKGLLDAMEAQEKKKAGRERRGKLVARHHHHHQRGLLEDALDALDVLHLERGDSRSYQDGPDDEPQDEHQGRHGNHSSNGGHGTPNPPLSASVSAVPVPNDIEYLSPVTIGGQTLHLDFDTGSSDLWVFTTHLDSATTGNHCIYNASASRTFKPIPGASFRIAYGDGSSAQGIVGTDIVDVGGASFATQAIELATSVSQQFVNDQVSDGLLGLAFSQMNSIEPQKQTTFLDNIKSTLAEPVLTADLRKGAPGTYTFGVIDSSRYRGPLTWIPVNTTRGFWQFESERFAVGTHMDGLGNRTGFNLSTSGVQAIADTGTTLILADEKVVKGYYAQVRGARNDTQMGGFTFPCQAELPDLELDVGGVYMAAISGRDVNFTNVGNGTCFGGVQTTPPGQLAVYGDIFFKSQFVVFHAGNNSLGMAPHA
ncbi:hypothetical protein E4U17_000856 [Claviceps sp. LM77 group G4]|nr:hypothetical protein E4U17_000856 [Claviceps sp. LM77 group G4]KAG6067798.1 hypothetical protein E4U33_005191 [Claviceps sp. LM78 group G4]KAG6071392.1 hypothetical protein E4U16_006137 [Claviceps sp. LM84 group G4]